MGVPVPVGVLDGVGVLVPVGVPVPVGVLDGVRGHVALGQGTASLRTPSASAAVG